MKRSEALSMIANQLDFLNGTFQGARFDHTEDELRKADVILTTLEEAGMVPPEIDSGFYSRENCGPLMVNEWEEETKSGAV